jgi:hypothetical protein
MKHWDQIYKDDVVPMLRMIDIAQEELEVIQSAITTPVGKTFLGSDEETFDKLEICDQLRSSIESAYTFGGYPRVQALMRLCMQQLWVIITSIKTTEEDRGVATWTRQLIADMSVTEQKR